MDSIIKWQHRLPLPAVALLAVMKDALLLYKDQRDFPPPHSLVDAVLDEEAGVLTVRLCGPAGIEIYEINAADIVGDSE